ncbi:integrase core domain-containing protein [Plantactinospora sp. B5E13]|uniref:integrase core domain-containing protein n=1 Tax=Plantactinospora sp. B5E13 TaxID=3153758 RepID=UPI00325CDB7D
MLRTPPQAPRANAFAERWVRTLRRECLDRILIYTTRHLLAMLGAYLTHYNGHRPHQGRGQRPPDRDTAPAPVTDLGAVRVRRRRVVHGLINEYEQAAWPEPSSRTAQVNTASETGVRRHAPAPVSQSGFRLAGR